jgi:hypothetical protein
MTRKRSRQAKGSLGNAIGGLQEILVDFRCIRPPVQTPANLFNNSLVSVGVKTLRGKAASSRLGVSENRRKFLAERNWRFVPPILVRIRLK